MNVQSNVTSPDDMNSFETEFCKYHNPECLHYVNHELHGNVKTKEIIVQTNHD